MTETTVAIVAEKKKPRKKKEKHPHARGKRKEAKARAVISSGTGKVFYNNMAVSTITDSTMRAMITEPLEYFSSRDTIDVSVSVNGGGKMAQAQAARTAIAKSLSTFAGDSVHDALAQSDRSFLVEDPRRVEPKKFKGPKARARFTKSYR